MWTLLHATGQALASWASSQQLTFVGVGAIVVALLALIREVTIRRRSTENDVIINLERLMSNTWVDSISSFDITVPDNVKISPNVLNGLRTAVENYNKNELPSSERSGSILNSRSVHFI